MFLKIKGYENVTSFISGKQALTNIMQNLPDLVILNIKLNDDVTGLDIAEYLSKLNVPFIFVSAFSNHDNYKKALKLNPASIFYKPVNHNLLLNSIDNILKNKNNYIPTWIKSLSSLLSIK